VAGIGLTLRKLTADGTFLGGAAAYFSSGVISAGPWLISVLSIGLLQGAIAAFLPADDRQLLFATITYAFVSSSILTGPIQLVLTRIVADHIFQHEVRAISSTFTRTLMQSIILLTCLIIPFLVLAPFGLAYRLLAASLFLTVSLIWLALAVISAVRNYLTIVLAFVIGFATSGGAAVWLGRVYGLPGCLEGFALGQVVCLAILIGQIYLEFPQHDPIKTPLYRYWREYWSLGLVGLCYYLGLWAEKLYYWFSSAGTAVHGFYRAFPPYDSAILLAYLLTIPAAAVFLVNLETDFYQHYRTFYMQIVRRKAPDGSRLPGGTFEQITQARLGMVKSARTGFWTLLKVQGMIAGFALLLAPDLGRLLGLPEHHLTTLRIAIIAASGQVFVLYAVLLLLYLDRRFQTLAVALVFAASNLVLTFLTDRLMPGVYGVGYLLSTLIAASLGWYLLNAVLAKLDYLTFMLQPLEAASKSPNGRAPASATISTPDTSSK
jgi:polysaccharide biosynthesis protein PelG